MAHLEIVRFKQGMSYSCKEKTIILNVYKYFRQQHPEKSVTDIVKCTSKATGCSEKSIYQFRKEEASAEGFKAPSTTKIRKNININSRDHKYDENVRQTIRNIIYDLKYKNVLPSLKTILKQIDNNSQVPRFSLMTLRRLLFDMGFSYEKSGNKYLLVEKPIDKSNSKKNSIKKKNKIKNKDPISTTAQQKTIDNEDLKKIDSQICVPMNNYKPSINEPKYITMQPIQQPPAPIPPPPHQHNIMPSMHPHMPIVMNHMPHNIGHHNIDMHLKREMPWMHPPTHPHPGIIKHQ